MFSISSSYSRQAFLFCLVSLSVFVHSSWHRQSRQAVRVRSLNGRKENVVVISSPREQFKAVFKLPQCSSLTPRGEI